MWKKTLLATAFATFSVAPRAAEPAAEAPPPNPPDPPNDPPRPDANQPVELEPVLVEGHAEEGLKADLQTGATKMPLSLRETPQSVSVITRESLDVRQVFNLQQALELSAGVTQYSGNGPFAGQPSFGFNQTTIRGIDIDSIYDFRDDGFVSGSFFSVPDLAIFDSIEVVKGPNSVLYGRGSVGGLINRVRKKPLAERRAEVELSGGAYDTYRADVDVTGPLLASKSLRGRVVGVYEDSGSFVDGPETQRTVLAPSLAFDLAAGTRMLVQALHQSEDIVPNTGTPLRPVRDANGGITGYAAPNISRHQYNGVVTHEPYTWKVQSALAQLEQQLGDRWLATLRLSSSNIDTPIRVDAYAYGFVEGDDPDTPEIERRGDTNVIGSQHWIDRDVWSGELQVTGRFDVAGKDVKLAFGADHSVNQYSRRGIYYNVEGFYGPGSEFNLYDGIFARPDESEADPGADFGGDPRSSGAYAQAQISATDRLKVLLGARYDEVQLRSVTFGVQDRETVSDVTGRVGLTYELMPQASLYTLYAQSFQPVLFETDINSQLLDPETGEIYELGAKTEWFDGRLGLSAAVYRIDRDKIPVSARTFVPDPDDPDGDPILVEYSVSSGLQRSEGFEIEVNGQPLAGWDLSLAYNNVNSEFKDPDDPFHGRQPGGTADWQLGFYTAYEVQGGPLHGLGLGLTRFEIAERGISTFVVGTLPGYERYDLHAFYKGLKNVEINLLVRNLTDEVYIEGADRANAYAQFGSPIAALLSIKYTLAAK
jgi:TonB-dependent siderophore receptor